MVIIKTMAHVTPNEQFESILKTVSIPTVSSHKGQNGKLLIIGGSTLFHAAALWAAEVASHFVDLLHFCSTVENNQVFLNLKSKFRNGIIVAQKDLDNYVEEDDCILVGPGMMREDHEEAQYTYDLTKRLMEKFPHKRFVFDAGAMQMMKKDWLKNMRQKPIVTPHQKEFARLFGVAIADLVIDEKKAIAQTMAEENNCIILLKTIADIVTDGKTTIAVEGGNSGLTKGGTGDVLAGLTAAFFTKNDAVTSAVLASLLLKSAAENLFQQSGLWYNTSDIVRQIPMEAKKLF